MKRLVMVIAAATGLAGLVTVFSYKPGTTATSATSATPEPMDQAAPTPSRAIATPAGRYKDGTYTGSTVNVGYGPVQVQAVISGGKLTGVNFLQMPSDRDHSARIAAQAQPVLLREALAAQSANVDLVTGATADWEGFVKSLQSALDQA